jgi:hypothetical protein
VRFVLQIGTIFPGAYYLIQLGRFLPASVKYTVTIHRLIVLTFSLERFLENFLSPAFAKRVLLQSAWSQIMVGGTHFFCKTGSDRLLNTIP